MTPGAPDVREDRGEADPAVVAALVSRDPERIRTALTGARLLVGVVALPGAEHASEGEMALALLESADGAKALPAFTGLEALHAWRTDARPVPRPAEEVLAYAGAESLAAVVIDPGSPHSCTLWTSDFAAPVADAAEETAAKGGPPTAPTWRIRRSTRRAARHPIHRSYAVDTADGPAVAVVCPDGTLDADWARALLATCPPDTQLIAVAAPPSVGTAL